MTLTASQPPRNRRRRAEPDGQDVVAGDDLPLVGRQEADAAGVPSSERVYRGLRDQILTGALEPNARLVELQLAAQFAVSRTPVREALKRLTAEGLVSVDPVRGMVVRDVDAAELEDIYVIREMLEGLAARLAAERITPTDLTKLHLLMELMEESSRSQRWEAVVQINIKFHEVLYDTARNERLALIGRSLQDAVRRYSSLAFTRPERVAAVLREHEELVRALEARDPDLAEATSRKHLAAARRNLSHVFRGEPTEQ